MMWLWAVTGALAQSDAYPFAAEVVLPETGVARVHVPPELRTLDDPGDGTDLLLVDATGRPVPFVRLEGSGTFAGERIEPTVRATADPDVFDVDLGELPLDALRVALVGSAEAATVTVRQRDRIVGGPTLVWRLPGGSEDVVRLPAVRGRVEVSLERHGPRAPRQPPGFEGLTLVDPGVAPDILTVDPGPPQLQESGWAVHDLPLERPLPISSVRLHAAEPTFERQAEVLGHTWDHPLWLGTQGLTPRAPGQVRRVTFGDVAVEVATLPAPRGAERLTLLVGAHDRPPLELETVDLVLDGVHLIVVDAGPGPHVLYAGAEPATSPTWDLGAAAAELARVPAPVVEPGPARPNPVFVPIERRANLVAPSTPLDVGAFRWHRPVLGDPGAVRIPVPQDVLAASRSDLSDLRLASDGRKVPHIVRRQAASHVLAGVTWAREEQGSRSLIRIEGLRDVPLTSVVLSSPAPLFDRTVTVQQVWGANLWPVRAVRWVGGDRPGRLAIDLGDARMRDALLVVVENGDDPPLPLDDVELRVPGWEIVAVLPEGETHLYYAGTGATAPDYDLSLLQRSLRRRTLPAAELGPSEAVAPPPLSVLERGMLGVGLGVLGIGLAALLLELLRRAGAGRTDYGGASAPEAP